MLVYSFVNTTNIAMLPNPIGNDKTQKKTLCPTCPSSEKSMSYKLLWGSHFCHISSPEGGDSKALQIKVIGIDAQCCHFTKILPYLTFILV